MLTLPPLTPVLLLLPAVAFEAVMSTSLPVVPLDACTGAVPRTPRAAVVRPLMLVAVATPRFGVVSAGLVASTAAGASGNVTVGSGAGGTASGTTSNGGNSGSVTIATGSAGTGTGANGTVGNVIFAPGGTTGATLTPTLLALGSGTTNAFPGLKRNGTAVNFRLADNSADAPITASTGTFSGALTGYEATTTKTSNYNVAVADVAQHFDNTGASGEVDFTLPAYAAGLRYCFTVTAAQTLKVIAPASNKIAIGTTNSAAAGNITASATYSTACIYATAVSNQWVAESTTGSWTVN